MTLQRLWSSFRAWPGYAQVLAWVIAWPIVTALLIAARARGTAGQLAALCVLLVGGSMWFGAFVGPDTERTATTTPVRSEPPPPGASDSQPSPTPPRRLTTASKRTPSPSPTPRFPDRVPPGVQPAVVERIVDGDTIWVRVDDAIEGGSMPANATSKVRLLEIDAPEATSTRECGGNKATAFVRKMTPVGAEVWLQADREDTDRYNRFLRLEPSGRRLLHLESDALDVGERHGLLGQWRPFDRVADAIPDRLVDDLVDAVAHRRVVAVADGV